MTQHVNGEGHLTYLAKQSMADSERWFGDQPQTQTLAHKLLCLGGEVGELQNVYKKIVEGRLDPHDPAVIMKLRMEAGDIQTYLLNVTGLLAFDMDAMLQYLRAENEKRFMPLRRERDARAQS